MQMEKETKLNFTGKVIYGGWKMERCMFIIHRHIGRTFTNFCQQWSITKSALLRAWADGASHLCPYAGIQRNVPRWARIHSVRGLCSAHGRASRLVRNGWGFM